MSVEQQYIDMATLHAIVSNSEVTEKNSRKLRDDLAQIIAAKEEANKVIEQANASSAKLKELNDIKLQLDVREKQIVLAEKELAAHFDRHNAAVQELNVQKKQHEDTINSLIERENKLAEASKKLDEQKITVQTIHAKALDYEKTAGSLKAQYEAKLANIAAIEQESQNKIAKRQAELDASDKDIKQKANHWGQKDTEQKEFEKKLHTQELALRERERAITSRENSVHNLEVGAEKKKQEAETIHAKAKEHEATAADLKKSYETRLHKIKSFADQVGE